MTPANTSSMTHSRQVRFKDLSPKPNPEKPSINASSPDYYNTLSKVEGLLGLNQYYLDEILVKFHRELNPPGNFLEEFLDSSITQSEYNLVITKLLTNQHKYSPCYYFTSKIFELISDNSSLTKPYTPPTVQVKKLVAVFSIFCQGDRTHKTKFTFDVFDLNNKGYFTLIQFTEYLSCIFLILFEFDKGLREKLGTNPEELSRVTAKQAFLVYSTNHQMSYDQFSQWCSISN